MKMKRHMGIDIKGVLTNWSKKEMGKLFQDEITGRRVPADEAKQELLTMLSEGKLLLPMGDCPEWNYQTGCPGHPMKESSATSQPSQP